MNGPLGRIVFPSFVLAMWVIFGMWLAQGDWTALNWLMLGTAAAATAIVFVDFVSVFSFGYATCMIVLPVEIVIVRGATTASVVVGGLAAFYGLRLWAFAWRRRRSASYAPSRAGEAMARSHVPMALKVLLFVLVTSLMTFESMSPYVVATKGDTTTWVVIGAAVMVGGLLIEIVADEQKHRAKEADNATFARNGLYARTRHPNYTGEILFQAGLAAAAFGSVTGWWQLVAVVLSPAYITVLMFFQAHSGDSRLRSRYGTDPKYVEYAAASGSLLPVRRRSRVDA